MNPSEISPPTRPEQPAEGVGTTRMSFADRPNSANYPQVNADYLPNAGGMRNLTRPARPNLIPRASMSAAEFNRRYPVGTAVRYWPWVRDGAGRESATRTPAWELGSGQAVVSVDGYSGGIHLAHVEVTE